MKACSNCKTNITDDSKFCAICGQKYRTNKVPLWTFMTEFVDAIFSFESRTLKTGIFLFRPGFLSSEFFEGRQIRYIHPLRIFLFTSTLFLAIVGLTINKEFMPKVEEFQENLQKGIVKKEVFSKMDSLGIILTEKQTIDTSMACQEELKMKLETPFDSIGTIDTPSPVKDFGDGMRDAFYEDLNQGNSNNTELADESKENNDGINFSVTNNSTEFSNSSDIYNLLNEFDSNRSENDGEFKNPAERALYQTLMNPDKMIQRTLGYLIWGILLIILLMVLFMKLIYVRKKMLFTEHLVFLFHIHAMVFLVLSPLIWFFIKDPRINLIAIPLSLFLFWAMKKYYKQGKLKTFSKWFLFLLAYLFTCVMVIASIMVAGVFIE